MRHHSVRAALAAASLTLSACQGFLSAGPDCAYEYRGQQLRGTLTSAAVVPAVAGADSGSGYISLYEERNFRTKATMSQRVGWNVQGSIRREDVTAVHLHEGAPGAIGPVLLDIPIDTVGTGYAFILTRTSLPVAYPGTIPFAEFFDRVRRGPVYLDVHTGQHPEGELRGALGPVTPANSGDWTHAYCS